MGQIMEQMTIMRLEKLDEAIRKQAETMASLISEMNAIRGELSKPDPIVAMISEDAVPQTDWRFAFDTMRQDIDYHNAIDTLLNLRRQPGSVAAQQGIEQFYIDFCDGEGEGDERFDPFVSSAYDLQYKVFNISPMFSTNEDAEAAIKHIGIKALNHMVKVLHGIPV